MKRYCAIATVCLLGGCLADDKKDVVTAPINNEQGQVITLPTVSLNGFWDGGFDQQMRALFYQGNVYAYDDNRGYYGTVAVNSDGQVAAEWQAYTINVGASNVAEKTLIADTSTSTYEWDALLSNLRSIDNLLIGVYSVNGIIQGNVEFLRESGWRRTLTLSQLALGDKWLAQNQELTFRLVGDVVNFRGISLSNPGCNIQGQVSIPAQQQNLYRITSVKREGCAALNSDDLTGYAGFNAEGDLEFYLRNSSNELLFMTFTPPAMPEPTPDPAPEPTPEPAPAP
ncbi:MAG: hypothetical protein IBX52_05880 [Bacterioplanes sp.]|nr:hypothetical protein [Bacterioplanes sp.]